MKKLFALILVFALVLSVAGCAATPATNTTAPAATGEEQPAESTGKLMKFTLTVVYADGTSKDFSYETDEEFVGPVLEAAGLIKGNAGPYGMEITHVDGVKAVYAEDKAYWAVYEGEEYAMQGIDTTPVKDGTVSKLVYTGA